MTPVTIENGRSVRRPVAYAAGRVAALLLKYAPYGQPRMQRLRYLAAAAAVVRLREVRRAADDHGASAERLRDALLHLALEAVHLHRRQELPVRELRQAVATAADAGKALGVVVPRRDVGVSDRPVDGDPVARVGLEVEVAPAVRLTSPEQRPSTHVIPAHPVEALDFAVGILDVVDEPVRRRRMGGVAGAVLFLLPGELGAREASAPRELPALHHGGRIVGMLHVPAALEDERPQPLFGQLLGRPAAADARPDDDGVIRTLGRSGALNEHGRKDTGAACQVATRRARRP